ncbi:MAG: mersacidin/lichenicidin family type 2 lantibiotic [Terriglobales bacterium]
MEGTVRLLMETPMAASISNLDIVRSWKDPRYRRNLPAQQFQMLPEHPAGAAMLTGRELKANYKARTSRPVRCLRLRKPGI